MITTKAEVLKYIKEVTENLDFKHTKNMSAYFVSQTLSISRSLASQYLNELYREGYLIKVSSRPVLYFHKEGLRYMYGIDIKNHEYLSIAQLQKELSLVQRQDDLYHLIGSRGTLKSAIDQVKASVSYPPYGLPLLLIGSTGVGKETLVKAILKDAKKNGIISKEKTLLVIDFKNTSLTNVLERLKSDTFGLVYFSNIHLLSKGEMSLLLDIVNRKHKISSSSMIMLSTDSKMSMSKEDFEAIPLKTSLLNFEERYLEERRAFVIRFLKDESHKLKRMIYVNQELIDLFANTRYEGQLEQVQNVIRMVCANANSDTNNQAGLEIHLYHIEGYVDQHLLSQIMNSSTQSPLIAISEFTQYDDALIGNYQQILLHGHSLDESIQKYLEYLLSINYDEKHVKDIKNSLKYLFNSHRLLSKERFFHDHLNLIALMIYTIKLNYEQVKQWEYVNNHLLRNILLNVKNKYPEEYQKVELVLLSIYNYMGIKINILNEIVLTVLISSFDVTIR